MLVKVHKLRKRGNNPFKYYKMWSSTLNSQKRVREAWTINMRGSAMFCIVQKLKNVKKDLKKLNKEGFDNIQGGDAKTYAHLIKCQVKLQEHNDR